MALVAGSLSPLEMDLGYTRKTCESQEKEKKQRDSRRMYKGRVKVHSGAQSVLQVLVYLEAPTVMSFGVTILSRLTRGLTGQGKTLILMVGVLIKGHKDTVTKKTNMAQWDTLMIFGWPSYPPCPGLSIPGQGPMCTCAQTEHSASWGS